MAAAARLFRNHIGRTWKLGFLATAAMFGFHVIVVRVFVTMSAAPQAGALGARLPRGLQQFMGIDKLPLTSLGGFLAVAYQHPFVMAALLAIPISIATALLAGEVEKRTIALLLSRGVGRAGIVTSCTLTCALWCLLMIVAAVAGTYAGVQWFGVESPPQPAVMLSVARNLLCLALAASGIAVAFSAFSNERGDAMGWVVTILLFMYVWNFIAQVWEPAKPYGDWSIFHYYSPTRLFLGTPPVAWDLQVLLAVGAAGYLSACLIFRFRDISI